jgi:hypothetical protein
MTPSPFSVSTLAACTLQFFRPLTSHSSALAFTGRLAWAGARFHGEVHGVQCLSARFHGEAHGVQCLSARFHGEAIKGYFLPRVIDRFHGEAHEGHRGVYFHGEARVGWRPLSRGSA